MYILMLKPNYNFLLLFWEGKYFTDLIDLLSDIVGLWKLWINIYNGGQSSEKRKRS